MALQIPTQIELDGQYRTLREHAGLLERDERRSILVTGAEAADFLQGQLTNEVESLEPNQGAYAALLDRKGHMQADMRVLRTEDGFRLDTEDVAADAVVRHLSLYKVGRDVNVEEVTDTESILSLSGPASSEIALSGPLGPEHAQSERRLEGASFVAVATEEGIDLIVARAEAATLSSALVARGAEAVSEEAAEIVRVEAGRPRFGREMTTATIPQEAGINDRAVSFTKGCYIGQETVARLHYKGRPNRHLRGLRLSGPARAGDQVRLGERDLGLVGSAVISPAHGPIALAILRREAEPGAMVSVDDTTSAEVVEPPF
jgi:folate-binding protein YgfZ